VREYVAHHAAEEVTLAMNQVCAALEETRDAFVSLAAKRTLERSKW
jgi:hypothetical protein